MLNIIRRDYLVHLEIQAPQEKTENMEYRVLQGYQERLDLEENEDFQAREVLLVNQALLV